MEIFHSDGKFLVCYGAVMTSEEAFPCLTIEFFKPGIAKKQRTFQHITDRGSYRTLDAAYEAACQLEVQSIDEDGQVTLKP